MREREDLVFVRSFRKLPCSVYALGNACSVFSYTKLRMIAMGLSKELWLPSKMFFGSDLAMGMRGWLK